MSDFDVSNLLAEVSGEAPCGEDISYDQDYVALENLVRPAGQTAVGEEEPQQEPKWSDVLDRSSELLQRSKNLRVALYATLAMLKLKGIPGLRDGLVLVRGLLERYWDCLYPQLDPEDKDDAFERMNVVSALSPRTVSAQDPMKFSRCILASPLCNSSQLGKFSARDIQIAKGQITVSDEEAAQAAQMSRIDAAFKDTPQEQLTATWQATQESLGCAEAITTVFSEKAGENQAPDLEILLKLLKGIAGFLQAYIDAPQAAQTSSGAIQGTSEQGAVSSDRSPPAMVEIRSREDVVIVLRKICDYFTRNEPSSPIPMLLRRAQRLVSKSFLEVIEDVCPDAMDQVEAIGGKSSRSDSNYETGQAEQ